MINLYTKFIWSMRWNTIEAVIYHPLLLGYQFFLFAVLDRSMYGLVGTIFSLLYLCATIANVGFDTALAPFFTTITKSKRLFRSTLFIQLIPAAVILATLYFGIYVMQDNLCTRYGINVTIITAILGIIFCDVIRKMLRVILQLAFLNHITAIIEVTTIIGYLGVVGAYYLAGHSLTISLIFIPMLLSSLVGTLALFTYVYAWYNHLPNDHKPQVAAPINRQLLHTRFYNYLNQCVHQLFSGNFLVPFFAVHIGLEQAGFFKLFSHIAYCITTILRKVFGLSSNSLLAHMKEMPLETKRDAFTFVTKHLNQVLYGIVLFFIINYKKILSCNMAHQASQCNWTLALLVLAISFSENFFITYEKFFIVEDKSKALFFLDICTMGLFYLVIRHASHLSPLALIGSIIGVRIISFILIGMVSFYYWQIKPLWQVNPLYLLYSLGIAITFFLLISPLASLLGLA